MMTTKTEQHNVAKRVYVVDNGGIPFIVELSQLSGRGIAQVHRLRNNLPVESSDDFEVRDVSKQGLWYKPWKSFDYKQVWVGLDPTETQKKSIWKSIFGTGWWHGGNSVLLQVAENRYISIGWDVYEFTTHVDDDIMDYVSVMGNSAVPYPYAVGKINTYLTMEKVSIPNHMVPNGMDPYNIFYEDRTIAHDRSGFRRKNQLIDIKILHKR